MKSNPESPKKNEPDVASNNAAVPTAIVYCEGNFAKVDGKTANGLVRHSRAYRIVSVIDSANAGRNSGDILDGRANGIPIVANLDAAITGETEVPNTFIYGMAPSNGQLSAVDRIVLLDAISRGMNIVSGLHEFLGDDPEISAVATAAGVTIRDIRKPRASKDMRLFDGSVVRTRGLRIAVMGTDCAIGKRTTATVLADALNEQGIRTVLIGTGQTGLIQGAKYGVALDAVPPQYCCGELEREIVAAATAEDPDIILIEGQGALSHPAFCTSAFILRGSKPHAVILQHAPNRMARCDFPTMAMPDPADEIALIEAFADTSVIGVTINHEDMTEEATNIAISDYSRLLHLPVTDALWKPRSELVNMVSLAFPELEMPPVLVA